MKIEPISFLKRTYFSKTKEKIVIRSGGVAPPYPTQSTRKVKACFDRKTLPALHLDSCKHGALAMFLLLLHAVYNPHRILRVERGNAVGEGLETLPYTYTMVVFSPGFCKTYFFERKPHSRQTPGQSHMELE